jgi:hypothetical protein
VTGGPTASSSSRLASPARARGQLQVAGDAGGVGRTTRKEAAAKLPSSLRARTRRCI